MLVCVMHTYLHYFVGHIFVYSFFKTENEDQRQYLFASINSKHCIIVINEIIFLTTSENYTVVGVRVFQNKDLYYKLL